MTLALTLSLLLCADSPEAVAARLAAGDLQAFQAARDFTGADRAKLVSLVLEGLHSKDPVVRRHAAWPFVNMVDPAAVAPLLDALEDKAGADDAAGNAKHYLVVALQNQRDSRAVGAFVRQLEAAAPRDRNAPVFALTALTGESFGTDVAAWKKFFEKNRASFEDATVREKRRAELSALMDQVTSRSFERRSQAAAKLIGFGHEAVMTIELALLCQQDGGETLPPGCRALSLSALYNLALVLGKVAERGDAPARATLFEFAHGYAPFAAEGAEVERVQHGKMTEERLQAFVDETMDRLLTMPPSPTEPEVRAMEPLSAKTKGLRWYVAKRCAGGGFTYDLCNFASYAFDEQGTLLSFVELKHDHKAIQRFSERALLLSPEVGAVYQACGCCGDDTASLVLYSLAAPARVLCQVIDPKGKLALDKKPGSVTEVTDGGCVAHFPKGSAAKLETF